MSQSTIRDAYVNKSPESARMALEARKYLAGGMSTDTRYWDPYGLIFERAEGTRKYDVDGNEYLDFFGGHGSLMLGHCHPEVQAAAKSALDRGSQFAGGHPPETEWARTITEFVPSADKVRFTASGTEATHLAIRLARAFTGKSKIVRFKGHYHGWHDHVCSGYSSHLDGSVMSGVLPCIGENTILLTNGSRQELEDAFRRHRDIAGVIMEPTGAHFGNVPLAASPRDVLQHVRELCNEHGSVFILDEVVSCFRIAPGGAQWHYGISPDITTLGKIITGGLPGGAVAGREDIMGLLDFEFAKQRDIEKVLHQGTFTGYPASAAAGAAAMKIIAATQACEHASRLAQDMRRRLNRLLESEKLPWAFYGDFSVFHFFTNPRRRSIKPTEFNAQEHTFEEFKYSRKEVAEALSMALHVHGVSVNRHSLGFLSGVHTAEDVDLALSRFEEALHLVKQNVSV
jgi:glutamate-1-semialdehyde 2,1-aminomutase